MAAGGHVLLGSRAGSEREPEHGVTLAWTRRPTSGARHSARHEISRRYTHTHTEDAETYERERREGKEDKELKEDKQQTRGDAATGYGLDGRGIRFRISTRLFTLSSASESGTGAHSASYPVA
jgi:hypothetical protein